MGSSEAFMLALPKDYDQYDHRLCSLTPRVIIILISSMLNSTLFYSTGKETVTIQMSEQAGTTESSPIDSHRSLTKETHPGVRTHDSPLFSDSKDPQLCPLNKWMSKLQPSSWNPGNFPHTTTRQYPVKFHVRFRTCQEFRDESHQVPNTTV